MVVLTALLMWMPVCGPFRSSAWARRGKMIYLFLQSVVPTVPAGWLTFAEGAVYKAYDQPGAAVGHSVTTTSSWPGRS